LDTNAQAVCAFITSRFDAEVLGFEGDFAVTGLATLRNPKATSLAFAKQAPPAGSSFPETMLLIVDPEQRDAFSGPRIAVERPRLVFALAVQEFSKAKAAAGIHPTAIIAASAVIDPSATIGAYTVIGEDCRIGANTRIGHHNVFGPRVEIGADCVVGSTNVIGEEGFGVEEFGDSQTVRLPSIGGVTIGDRVEIGNFNALVAGTMDPTVIEDDCQIDNLIHIAHNAHIGAGSLVIACAEISGSVRLGKRVWVGPNACIKNGLEIGDDCLIGIGATVIKSSEPNAILAGNPAKKLGDRR
jgi:UDP-3-O-[3-hydroxymyristoyl] glucosamine N-acyltransferase